MQKQPEALSCSRTSICSKRCVPMKCEGRTPLKIHCKGKVTSVMALVSSSMKDEILISMTDLKRVHLLNESIPDILVNQVTWVASTECDQLGAIILADFKQVFNDTLKKEPMAGEPMIIHLKENAKTNAIPNCKIEFPFTGNNLLRQKSKSCKMGTSC